MRDLVLHVPSGVTLDLGDPDYGHPDGPALIAATHRHCSRGTLICEKHQSDLFLQARKGRYTGTRLFGIHFDGGHEHPVARMSDEHKRQTEYLIRPALDAGLSAPTEVRLATGVRPDAVVYGSRSIALEIQRSPLTASAAVTRVRKAVGAGIAASLWFSDWQDRKPSWLFRVPSIGLNPLGWDSLPPRRAATVRTGLRVIEAVRCDPVHLPRCPRGRRHCGKYHEQHRPWLGLVADDVVTMAAGGMVAPLRFRGRDVILVSPESVRLYEELTGAPAEVVFNPFAEKGRPAPSHIADRIACVSAVPVLSGTQLQLIYAGTRICYAPGCDQPAGPGGILCATCKAKFSSRAEGRM